MAQISSKIAPFPGCVDKRPTPVAANAAPPSGDPTKELRTYIESLQEESRVARQHQEAAEEDRDRLAEEIRRLQRELEAANEARKQVRSVIIERDNLRAALEKSEVILVEVRRKADASDRQRAQAETQREQAMRLYKETRQEADQHLAARDEASRQRDAALRQRAQALKDHEEAVGRIADLQRQTNELQRGLVEAQAGANKSDGAIQKQLLSIRQARDSAAAQAAELKNRIGELEDKIAELTYDREVSDSATKKAVVEVEAARLKSEEDKEKLHMLETLQAELAEVGQELTSLRQQHAVMQGAKEQLVAQLREFRETHEAMLISNTSQLESTTKERDVLRTRLQERENELQEVRAELASTWASAMQVTEPEIERLSSEVETMRTRAAEIDSVMQHAEEMTRQREEMRLQVIELTAQLENARREIKEIGAQLAEARLQLKLAKVGVASGAKVPVSAPVSADSASSTATAPTRRDHIGAIQDAWKRWQPDAEDSGSVWDLARETAAFAGSCQAAGEQTLHRVATKLAALSETFMAAPQAATPRLHAFVGEAVDFLARLEDISGLDRYIRLTGRRAYVLEADRHACAAIADELRAAGFMVESADNPSSAIAELASHNYDLIVLDAELPELSGAELCGCIRGMEQHAATPIVLVGEANVEAAEAERVAFVSKPFLPEELALRVMIELVKAQLEPA
jgi:CheY-like chemotaxis protein/chromosome segregation ATPase